MLLSTGLGTPHWAEVTCDDDGAVPQTHHRGAAYFWYHAAAEPGDWVRKATTADRRHGRLRWRGKPDTPKNISSTNLLN